jgi:hypothetical protein
VFVLTDQCFPPYLTGGNFGNCIQIVRVEFATLMELGRVFVDIFTGTSLPVGSVVILSSASHLASVGTAGYAEDMARCSKYLLQAFSNNIIVKHGVPIF